MKEIVFDIVLQHVKVVFAKTFLCCRFSLTLDKPGIMAKDKLMILKARRRQVFFLVLTAAGNAI